MLVKKILFLIILALSLSSFTPVNGYVTTIIIDDNGIAGTDKISQDGNLYVFTEDIDQPIVIDIDDIILDGKGYSLNVLSSYDAILIENHDGIKIKNIKIIDGKTGFNIVNASRCVFSNNTITGMAIDGIKARGTLSNIDIRNNIIEENPREGISIRGESSYVKIRGNKVIRNDRVGILLETSNYSEIYENTVIDQEEYGIVLTNSYKCMVYRNQIDGNRQGIFLAFESIHNEIYENKILDNEEDGIELNDSTYNLIFSNIIKDNGDDGLDLENSVNNTIYQNDITSNKEGIDFDVESPQNIVYNNNLDNPSMVTYRRYNYHTWNLDPPIGGNYWSDYNGLDQDEDGFGDTPHILYRDSFGEPDMLNRDYYPLIQPYVRNSQILQSITSGHLYPGDEVVIDGQIYPATVSMEITIELTSPSGSTVLKTVVTDDTGLYTYTFIPEEFGEWRVVSSWTGDDFYEGIQSVQHTLTVDEPEIMVSISLDTIETGDTVTVTGQIDPSREDETIILEITGPDTDTRNIVTSNGGRYSYSYTPAISGDYRVEVKWGQISATASFTVEDPEPEPEPEPETDEKDQRGGIPIPISYIVIGLALTVILQLRKSIHPAQ